MSRRRKAVRKSTEKPAPPAWLAAALLALSIGAVYLPALDAPFIFDDRIAIVGNDTILSLWPLVGTTEHPGPLYAGRILPTSSRPLVNLSFAINYHFGGFNPTGYHVINVTIHCLSALLIWVIVRRTLRLPYFSGRFDAAAGRLALAVAMLWALHPLVTEAVIYTTQRAELMMALFYLATLYCSLRYWSLLPLPRGDLWRAPSSQGRGEGALEANQQRQVTFHRSAWLTLAVLASLCGMASKEVMVSAPLIVLLFERTFILGSLRNALRRSWPLYVGLTATWLLLLGLRLSSSHDESTGFRLGVPAYVWWFTQAKVLLMYLKLAVLPWPLLIHYQFPYLMTFADAWVYVAPVLLLGVATLLLLWRNNSVGYLATCVFAILAPTSVIPILLEMAAERRMYLPLVALTALVVVGGYQIAQTVLSRWSRDQQSSFRFPQSPFVAALPVFLLALALSLLSAKRVAAYRDEISLWRDVLHFQPDDPIAHTNMGLLLTNSGRLKEAVDSLEAALALKPDDINALNRLGIALMRLGRFTEAREHFVRALRLEPTNAETHNNLGLLLSNSDRLPEAIDELQAALALKPDYPVALNNLAIALIRAGRFPDAIQHLEHAVRLQPDYVDAHNNLGLALSRSGRIPAAIEQFRLALQTNQNDANTHYNLANLLAATGRVEEALPHYERVVQLRPDYADGQNRLGEVLRQTGRHREAMEHFKAAVRLQPDHLQAYANLAQALATANRPEEAVATAERAIKLAQSKNQEAAAQQIKQWLQHYQQELHTARDSSVRSP